MNQKFELYELSVEKLNFDGIEELEEVVTPGWGTIGCCTN